MGVEAAVASHAAPVGGEVPAQELSVLSGTMVHGAALLSGQDVSHELARKSLIYERLLGGVRACLGEVLLGRGALGVGVSTPSHRGFRVSALNPGQVHLAQCGTPACPGQGPMLPGQNVCLEKLIGVLQLESLGQTEPRLALLVRGQGEEAHLLERRRLQP